MLSAAPVATAAAKALASAKRVRLAHTPRIIKPERVTAAPDPWAILPCGGTSGRLVC